MQSTQQRNGRYRLAFPARLTDRLGPFRPSGHFVSSVTDQLDQTNQIDQIDQIDQTDHEIDPLRRPGVLAGGEKSCPDGLCGNPFLFIAMSSAAEVQSHLYIALDQGYIDQKQFDEMYTQASKTAKMISGLVTYLRTTSTK